MGKSKHPPLAKKALADIARVNTLLKKEATALKNVAKACGETQKMATSTAGDLKTQYGYLQDVIEKYVIKCVEIEQMESDLAAAKGNKKKEAEIKKSLAKAEKEADAIRKEYGLAGKVFSTLSDLMRGQIDSLGSTCSTFNGFYPA